MRGRRAEMIGKRSLCRGEKVPGRIPRVVLTGKSPIAIEALARQY